jgi:hypothetical protein
MSFVLVWKKPIVTVPVISTGTAAVVNPAVTTPDPGPTTIVVDVISTGTATVIAPQVVTPTTGDPVAPTEYVPPAYSLPGGAVHTPANSSELTSLLAGGDIGEGVLAAGDVIQLDKNVTYSGNFNFPDLSPAPDQWTYVISDGVASLPAQGTRVGSAHAANLAKVYSPNTYGAISCNFSSSYYRFVGIHSQSTHTSSNTTFGLFITGWLNANHETPDRATSDSQLPSNIVLDRCYFHGREDTCNVSGERHLLRLNANKIAVLDSTIDGCRTTGGDAMAIETFMGGSGYSIINCRIEGSSHSYLSGGTDASITNGIPSDIVFRKCYMRKPLDWDEDGGTWDGLSSNQKNHWELKNAKRVLLEQCILENVWHAGQHASIVITARNQENGAPWSTVEDVLIRHNIIRDAVNRITFEHNLMYNISTLDPGITSSNWINHNGGSTRPAEHIRINHNTWTHKPSGTRPDEGIYFEDDQQTGDYFDNYVMKDNIFADANKGWMTHRDYSDDTDGMNAKCINWTVENNVIFDISATSIPNNWSGAGVTEASINFVDTASAPSGFALTGSTTYAAGGARQASDGLDMGADVATIVSLTAGVDS